MKNVVLWLEAARPKTLFASISPILIGISFATHQGAFSFFTALCTLLGALAIQIGTNFANDYFDFLKGADTLSRKGPRRLTQSGVISPKKMKQAAFIIFAAALFFSLYLMFRGGFPFIVLTPLSILLGIGYTAGPWPLAYKGVGEVFVLLFFGPIATSGAAYLQTLSFSWEAVFLGLSPGLISTAVLATNNLRDREGDKDAFKNTLAVRWGKRFAQVEYTLCLLGGIFIPIYVSPWIPMIALLPAYIPLKKIWNFTDEKELNIVLAQTGKIGFLVAVMIAASICFC